MIIFRDAAFALTEPAAVTFGKFDGIHRGHQKLMRQLLEEKKRGKKAVVFTFSQSPRAIVTGQSAQVLMTMEERERYLEEIGIDYLIEYPCDETLIRTSAELFVKDIVIGKCHADVLIVGTDFRFGYGRAGDPSLLKRLAPFYGYELITEEKELDEESGREISSTYIKEEILQGRMEHAAKMLGEPYSFEGTVMHGIELARKLNIPTMNLHPSSQKLLPPFGVYCVRALVEGTWYDGIANLGCKPTVTNQNQVKLETYLFNFYKFVYGKTIRVMLYSFVRAEQTFPSVRVLKEQMERDVRDGKRYFSSLPPCEIQR